MQVLCMTYIGLLCNSFVEVSNKCLEFSFICCALFFYLLVLILIAYYKSKCGDLFIWVKHLVIDKHMRNGKERT